MCPFCCVYANLLADVDTYKLTQNWIVHQNWLVMAFQTHWWSKAYIPAGSSSMWHSNEAKPSRFIKVIAMPWQDHAPITEALPHVGWLNILHQMISDICIWELFWWIFEWFLKKLFVLLINILAHLKWSFRSVCEAGRDVSVTFNLTLSMLITEDHEGKG